MRSPRPEPLSTTTVGSSPSSSTTQQPQQVQAPQQPPPPPQRQPRSSRRSQDSRASATTATGPDSNGRFLPRYHINNFDTGGMPVSLWGMDRRDVWRTCFCFHVRTVTIFIGVWYLMIYILELSFNAALLMYEPGQDGFPGNGMITVRPETMLPTPVSKIGMEPKPFEIPNAEKLTIDRSDLHRSSHVDTMRNNGPLHLLEPNRKATSQVILLTVCNMLITLLMVYGAVRGKPSYLMPFFVLRVFDFCIFCLTMVNYFSYLPNVTEGIMNNNGMPFREEFLKMDRQLLSFISLIFIVAFIAVKAYIIGVIWNCYKYLMLRNTVIRGVIAYRHDDPTSIMGLQQNLLPDLPDYETAVNDPRYAKKPPSDGASHTTVAASASAGGLPGGVIGTNPSSIAMPPPPPYSVAVASEPLYLVMPMPTQQNLVNSADPTTPANTVVPQPAHQNNNNNNAGKEVIVIEEEEESPVQEIETNTTALFVPVHHPQVPESSNSAASAPDTSAAVITVTPMESASTSHGMDAAPYHQ